MTLPHDKTFIADKGILEAEQAQRREENNAKENAMDVLAGKLSRSIRQGATSNSICARFFARPLRLGAAAVRISDFGIGAET